MLLVKIGGDFSMKKKVMLKGKLLRVSILLMALCTATIFFVTNSNVNNLVENNVKAKLESISYLGMDIIKSKYYGDWKSKGGKLFIGENPVNENFEILDAIKEKTGAFSAIYLGDESVASNLIDGDGKEALGAKLSNEEAKKAIKNGYSYNGVEDVFGQKYDAKYVPIRDDTGEIIGTWLVGVLKSDMGSQNEKMREVRTSIIVISVLCGMLGCIILMIYSKKYLKDVDTLKVSFLGSSSNNNKTQQKVLRMSFLLIGTFVVIWFVIQGFTIGNVANKIIDSNIKDRLKVASELGYMLIDEKYKGDWTINDNKLFKGTNSINGNAEIVDTIGSITESRATVFMNDTRVTTNILQDDGKRAIGTKASNEVINTVLNQGKEFEGETTDLEKSCMARYMPIEDSSGKTIGMWFIGVDKKFINKQITSLRKPISQISLLAIIIAFLSFLFLSRRMVYDVDNFDIKLSA